MLRRQNLVFVMVIYPALKELRRAIAARRGGKRPAVSVGMRGTDGPIASHHT